MFSDSIKMVCKNKFTRQFQISKKMSKMFKTKLNRNTCESNKAGAPKPKQALLQNVQKTKTKLKTAAQFKQASRDWSTKLFRLS